MSTSDQSPVVREQSTYLSDTEAATFCTVFGDGLGSGMNYGRIIDMLERQGFNPKAVKRLRSAIMEQGMMLGEALARYGLLDPTARKLVYVAEQQGRLPSTFKDLGHHYKQRQERRKRLVYSFVEPGILIALGLILAINIFGGDLTELVQADDVWDELIPIFIQSALEIGIFGSIAFLAGMTYLNLPVDMPLRNALHRLWLRFPLPIINSAGRLFSVAHFCRYTAQSISSGLTVHRALSLAAEASNNPSIEKRIPIAQQAIEEGQMLAASLRYAKAIPPEAIDYIDVGEESGRLEERLRELSDRYEKEANEQFERTMHGFIYTVRILVIVTVIGLLMLTLGDLFDSGLAM